MRVLPLLLAAASACAAAPTPRARVPATEFAFNDAGTLPCYAAQPRAKGQVLRPVDIDMSLELLANITDSRVYATVPDRIGGGDYGYFNVREEGGDYLVAPDLLEDNPGKYHMLVSHYEATSLRMFAAWSEHKTVDDNNREWSRVDMTLEARYRTPGGNLTEDFHVSSAPMWVETSCRFAEDGPLGQLTVPTEAEGITVNTASGHFELNYCREPRLLEAELLAPVASTPAEVIVQPAKDFDSMRYVAKTWLFNPDTGSVEIVGNAITGYGAVVPDVKFTPSASQLSYLEANYTLPGRIEIYYYSNLTAFNGMSSTNPTDYDVLVNETIYLSTPTKHALSDQDAIDFVTNKTFASPEWASSLKHAFHRFTSLYNASANAIRTDKVNVETFSIKNNANTTSDDDTAELLIYEFDCAVEIKAGNHYFSLKEYNNVTSLFGEGFTNYQPRLRETPNPVQVAGLLRVLSNDWTSEVRDIDVSFSASGEEKDNMEQDCVHCCVSNANLRLADSPDFVFNMTYDLVGPECPFNGTHSQDRIAMTRFADYLRTGLETPKLYTKFAAAVPPGPVSLPDLTVDFVPKHLADGKVAVYVGAHHYSGDMTLLDTNFECPYVNQVPQEYVEVAEFVCGPLQQPPTTTKPSDDVPGSAYSAASSVAVVAAIVAAFAFVATDY
ncbi:MAG: hypothetical protein MHM6MM_005454 [Cercozoa sp. M6MM]